MEKQSLIVGAGARAGLPNTIVLAAWPRATTHMIEHYVQGYQELFPKAQIRVLYPESRRPRPGSKRDGRIISRHDPLSHSEDFGNVLLHVFGDDAADEVCRWLRSYQRQQLPSLNVRWAVMDDEPTTNLFYAASWSHSLEEYMDSAKSTATCWWQDPAYLVKQKKPASRDRQTRELHRDDGLLPAGVLRCYVVGDANMMFFWRQCRQGVDEDDHGVCGMEERLQESVRRSAVDSGAWNQDRERYWSLIGRLCSA